VTDYLTESLAPYDLSLYSALVLGCTHFNYFKDSLRALLPEKVKLVDGNEGTVRELIRQLKSRGQLEDNAPAVEYYYSGRRVRDEAELARLNVFLKRLRKMHEL
jgi:glutamate racemase